MAARCLKLTRLLLCNVEYSLNNLFAVLRTLSLYFLNNSFGCFLLSVVPCRDFNNMTPGKQSAMVSA